MKSGNKKRMLKFKLFALAAMTAFLATSAVYAIDFDGYKLTVSLTAKETYDDNYFLVPGTAANPEQDAWITTVTPDLKLEVGEISKITLGFKSDLIAVDGFSGRTAAGKRYRASDENRQNQTYTARFDYNPGQRLSLSLSDTLIDAEDQASAEGTDRTIRVQNDLKANLKYRFGERAGFETILAWSAYDFNVFNKQLTRHEYYATVRGTYLLSASTEAFLGYRYSDFVFTGLKFILPSATGTAAQLDMDNQAHAIQVGLKFNQMPMGGGKLQGEIWGGYEKIDFQRQDDQDQLVLEGRLTYLPTARTTAVLALKRAHTASTLQSGTNSINSTVRLDVTYKFYEKLEGTAGVGYRNADYQEPVSLRTTATGVRSERKDNTYTVRAGVKYNFYKYFTAGVNYELSDKNVSPASLRSSEYQDNKITFLLNGTF